jgi:catechol 2,3-dioxygenase-like lactoylglutathione lyase family enzyme
VDIEFLSTVAVIAPDPPASRKLYVDALGLPLESAGDGEYLHSERIAGCKSFGIWPLSQAAGACFGTQEWPADRPVPQVSIEFDARHAAGITQVELAARAGTTQPAVASYESGAKMPNLSTLSRLLDGCEHDIEVLARPRVRQGTASLAALSTTISEDLSGDREATRCDCCSGSPTRGPVESR